MRRRASGCAYALPQSRGPDIAPDALGDVVHDLALVSAFDCRLVMPMFAGYMKDGAWSLVALEVSLETTVASFILNRDAGVSAGPSLQRLAPTCSFQPHTTIHVHGAEGKAQVTPCSCNMV